MRYGKFSFRPWKGEYSVLFEFEDGSFVVVCDGEDAKQFFKDTLRMIEDYDKFRKAIKY